MNLYHISAGTGEDVEEQREEMTASVRKNICGMSAVSVFTVCCLLVYSILNK